MLTMRHFCRLHLAAITKNVLPISVAQYSSPWRHSASNNVHRLSLCNFATENYGHFHKQQHKSHSWRCQSQQRRRFFSSMTSRGGVGDRQDGITTAAEDGQQSTGIKMPPPIGEHGDLEEKWFPLGDGQSTTHQQQLKILIGHGKSGHKFIRITKFNIATHPANRYYDFAKIRVPEEAYSFIGGLDRLMEGLATRRRWEGRRMGTFESIKISGARKDYQLDLFTFNEPKKGGKIQIGFEMRTVQSVKAHRERWLTLPFRALPWLRREMVGMLARHDGSQQLGPAPEIPDGMLEDQSLPYYKMAEVVDAGEEEDSSSFTYYRK